MSCLAPIDDVSRSTLRRRASRGVKKIVKAVDDFNNYNQSHRSIHSPNSNAGITRSLTSSTTQNDELLLASNSETATSSTSIEANSFTSMPMECIPPLSDSDDSLNEENSDEPTNLSQSLSNWSVRFGISLVALSALLDILHPYFSDLPKDGRTLLKTKRVYDIRELGGGQYYHFGLLKSIKCQLAKFVDTLSLTSSTCLALQINVDGLPLFKISNFQLWPILGRLLNVKTSQPFVIGVFSGKKSHLLM